MTSQDIRNVTVIPRGDHARKVTTSGNHLATENPSSKQGKISSKYIPNPGFRSEVSQALQSRSRGDNLV